MGRRVGTPTRRWLFYVAVLAAWLLGAELTVVTTLGRNLPNRLPAVAGWAFVVLSAVFLVAVARWEVRNRGRAARLVDQLNVALGSITALTEASLSMLPVDELLDQLLGRLEAVLAADVAAILVPSSDGKQFAPRAIHGAVPTGSARSMLAADQGLIGQVLASDALCESRDPGLLQTLAARFDRDLASAAACPIRIERRLIGICLAGRLTPTRFDERELHLLRLVADRAGLGIERARLDEADHRSRMDVERARRRAIMLAAASDAVATAQDDYEANLAALVDVAVPEFADWCAIDLADTDGTLRRLVIRHGLKDAATRHDVAQMAWCSAELRERVLPVDEMVARAYAAGGSELWSSAGTLKTPTSRPGDPSAVISCIATSICDDDLAFGVITFATDRGGAGYGVADVAVAEDVARRAGVAVERARLYRTLQRSEARWRVLVEAAPVGIVEVDLSGRAQWWNRAAAGLFSWPEQQLGGPLAEEERTFPHEAEAKLVDLWAQVTAGVEVVGRDLGPVLVGGERRDLSVSAAPLLTAGGAVHGILTLIDDVTQRRHLESELRQAQRMEVIGQLAGGVAHEFNNLLTLISGYTELLRRRLDADERAQAVVGDIQAATVRASVLTGQLLTISRRQPLRPVVLAPASVVRSLSEVLERVVRADVEVSWSLDPAAGRVRIDHGQFEQLVLNLAINARDAMPRGGWLHITVAAVRVDTARAAELEIPPGEYVRVAVADSGSGMDEETRRRCFEPLYTTKGPSKGSGLGLPAVRRVVLECGGAIRFDTERGRGTTFDVFLPRIEEEDEDLGDVPSVTSTIVRASETVLLAEDDDGLRQLVHRVLSHHGYCVLEATSGQEAIEIASRHDGPIDVLVSDVIMPGLNGRDVALRLRDERPGLAVLLVSGSTDATILVGLRSGPTGFLAKPFKPSEIVSSVRELLDRRPEDQPSGHSA
jgi:PAS domain S-box-containing protein